jgi:Flp pilus assembly protein TadG
MMKRRPSRRQRRGAVTVEFAFCASILFMVTMAAFEFSRFVMARHAVDQAAYEAARTAITPGAKHDDVVEKAERLLQATGISHYNIDVQPATIDHTTREVSVEVSASFANNTWVPAQFFGGAEMRSRTELDHENRSFLDESQLTSGPEPAQHHVCND